MQIQEIQMQIQMQIREIQMQIQTNLEMGGGGLRCSERADRAAGAAFGAGSSAI